jgi:tetratricopeptide (TPR) repeat protein
VWPLLITLEQGRKLDWSHRLLFRRRPRLHVLAIGAGLLLSSMCLRAQDNWSQQVQIDVNQHLMPAALTIVDRRLAEAPDDMEAHGWRGRLLAWTGQWTQAEAEYHVVLDKFPNDVDVLAELADVLIWQKKYSEALTVLEQARKTAPHDPETLLRRARVLALLRRSSEARSQFHAVLSFDPTNRAATNGLEDLASASKYEVRIGEEADFFNYTDDAQVETGTLVAHWNEKWTTGFGASQYHLFGENATRVWADAAYRFRENNWARVLGGAGNPQDVVPERDVLFEYGHGFRFSNLIFRGLESSYQEHSLWYRGAQVISLNTTQTVYLPREWTWTVSTTASRTRFANGRSAWVPSGSTKVGVPLLRRLSGSLLFAVGAENFAQVDQIGRLSARSYGGGLRYRFAESQDVTVAVSRQDRERGQKQISLGLSYGIRF